MRIFLASIFTFILCLPAHAEENVLPGPVAAEVLHVIDGDSIKARVRVWLDQEVTVTVRLLGVDTPELKSRCEAEHTLAMTAKNRLAELVADKKLELYNIHRDKYGGRVLAHIRTDEQADIARTLIAENLARPYFGKKRGSWCEGAKSINTAGTVPESIPSRAQVQ